MSMQGGLLLYGHPRCGKTFIARALAGELHARFRHVGLEDVLDMYLGESERRPATTEFADDQGDVWDSGKVTTNATKAIVHSSEPLQSGQHCYWKVRAWGCAGERPRPGANRPDGRWGCSTKQIGTPTGLVTTSSETRKYHNHHSMA